MAPITRMNPVALYLMARQSARDLIQTNTPLNQGIAKHASTHGLSQLQIQRVVESANHEANALFQKTARDKTFSFDLASLDGVLASLTTQTAGHVVSFTKAAEHVDALLEPGGSFDTHLQAFPDHDPAVRAADFRGALINLDKVAGRATALHRQLQAEAMTYTEKVAQGFNAVLELSKEYVRRGGSMADIQKFAHSVDPEFEQGWDLLLGRICTEMRKLGHPFTGELATITDLTSDRPNRPGGSAPVPMQIRVANGQHALVGELRYLRDGVSYLDRLQDRTRDIDNFRVAIRVAQHRIKDNDDVDTLICKQAEYLAGIPESQFPAYIERLAKAGAAEVAAKGLVGTVIDHVGKASIKAAIKRGTSDWVPGAFTGPGTPATYRSKKS